MSLPEIRFPISVNDKDITQESMLKAIAEIKEVIKKYPQECIRLNLDNIRDNEQLDKLAEVSTNRLFDLLKEEVIRNARNSCPPIPVSEQEIDFYLRNNAGARYSAQSKGETHVDKIQPPVRPPLRTSEERWTGPIDTRLRKS